MTQAVVEFVEYNELKPRGPQVFLRQALTKTQLVERLTTSLELQSKDAGKLYAPNTFSPAYTSRAKAGVTSVTFLVYDLERKDPGLTEAEVLALNARLEASGTEYVLYSTYSNKEPDNCRFRLVLFLSRPLVPTEFKEARRRVAKRLALDGIADPAADDISRISFWPSHPPGAEPVAVYGPGVPLDVDSLLAGFIPAPFNATEKRVPEGWEYTRPESPPVPFDLEPLRKRLRLYKNADARKENLVKRILKGERLATENFNSAMWSAANLLAYNLPAGTSVEEILALLQATLHTTYGDGSGPIPLDHALDVAERMVERAVEARAESEAAAEEIRAALERSVEKTSEVLAKVEASPPAFVADLAAVEFELEPFVYCIPEECYYYALGGAYQLHKPVGRESIIAHLRANAWDDERIKAAVHGGRHTKVYGKDFAPRMPPLFPKGGVAYLNSWVPPTLVPQEGEWPSIQRVLESLTFNDHKDEFGETISKQDADAVTWIINWLAWTVQNPAGVPGTAILMNGSPTGTGKNTLAYVMCQILGTENCRKVTIRQLENRFTASWIDKCFIYGDEILNRERINDISDHLKDLITGQTVSKEGKGKAEYEIRNRAKYLLFSNHDIPIRIEANDRRFSVFTRNEPVTPEYKYWIQSLFTSELEATPEFRREIAAFAYYLERYPVDGHMVRTVYDNHSRQAIIRASAPAHLSFCAYVDEFGINALLDDVIRKECGFVSVGEKGEEQRRQVFGGPYDFGDRGVSTQALYMCYRLYAKRSGIDFPIAVNRFGLMIRSHRPIWRHSRPKGDDGSRPNCYIVRRKPEGTDGPPTEAPDGVEVTQLSDAAARA